jgi:hypothetical protein
MSRVVGRSSTHRLPADTMRLFQSCAANSGGWRTQGQPKYSIEALSLYAHVLPNDDGGHRIGGM